LDRFYTSKADGGGGPAIFAKGLHLDEISPSPFENIFDQLDAMQAVAPEGFKIHFDFTMHGTDDHMFTLLDRMAAYRIAGCFEDR